MSVSFENENTSKIIWKFFVRCHDLAPIQAIRAELAAPCLADGQTRVPLGDALLDLRIVIIALRGERGEASQLTEGRLRSREEQERQER